MLKNRWSWLSSADPSASKHPWSKGIQLTSFQIHCSWASQQDGDWCGLQSHYVVLEVPSSPWHKASYGSYGNYGYGLQAWEDKKWDEHPPTWKKCIQNLEYTYVLLLFLSQVWYHMKSISIHCLNCPSLPMTSKARTGGHTGAFAVVIIEGAWGGDILLC